MEEQQEKSGESQEKPQEKKEKKFWNRSRISFALIIPLVIIILIILKTKNPQFPLSTIFIIGGATAIISGAGIFYEQISKKLREISKKENEKEIPDPLTEQELKERVRNYIQSEYFENHIEEWGRPKTIDVGGNTIKVFDEMELFYDDDDYIFIINANFPERITFLHKNSERNQVRRAINEISTKPQEEPSKDYFEAIDPKTGVAWRGTQSKKKEEKPREHKMKEDIM